MPDPIIKFNYDGKNYAVPENQVDGFLSRKPDAKVLPESSGIFESWKNRTKQQSAFQEQAYGATPTVPINNRGVGDLMPQPTPEQIEKWKNAPKKKSVSEEMLSNRGVGFGSNPNPINTNNPEEVEAISNPYPFLKGVGKEAANFFLKTAEKGIDYISRSSGGESGAFKDYGVPELAKNVTPESHDKAMHETFKGLYKKIDELEAKPTDAQRELLGRKAFIPIALTSQIVAGLYTGGTAWSSIPATVSGLMTAGFVGSSAYDAEKQYKEIMQQEGKTVDQSTADIIGLATGITTLATFKMGFGKLLPKFTSKVSPKIGETLAKYYAENPQTASSVVNSLKESKPELFGYLKKNMLHYGEHAVNAGTAMGLQDVFNRGAKDFYTEDDKKYETEFNDYLKGFGVQGLHGAAFGIAMAGVGKFAGISKQRLDESKSGVVSIATTKDGESIRLNRYAPNDGVFTGFDRNGVPKTIKRENIASVYNFSKDKFKHFVKNPTQTEVESQLDAEINSVPIRSDQYASQFNVSKEQKELIKNEYADKLYEQIKTKYNIQDVEQTKQQQAEQTKQQQAEQTKQQQAEQAKQQAKDDIINRFTETFKTETQNTVHEDGFIHPVKIKGNEEVIAYVVKGDERNIDSDAYLSVYNPKTGKIEFLTPEDIIPGEAEYKTPEQAYQEQFNAVVAPQLQQIDLNEQLAQEAEKAQQDAEQQQAQFVAGMKVRFKNPKTQTFEDTEIIDIDPKTGDIELANNRVVAPTEQNLIRPIESNAGFVPGMEVRVNDENGNPFTATIESINKDTGYITLDNGLEFSPDEYDNIKAVTANKNENDTQLPSANNNVVAQAENAQNGEAQNNRVVNTEDTRKIFEQKVGNFSHKIAINPDKSVEVLYDFANEKTASETAKKLMQDIDMEFAPVVTPAQNYIDENGIPRVGKPTIRLVGKAKGRAENSAMKQEAANNSNTLKVGNTDYTFEERTDGDYYDLSKFDNPKKEIENLNSYLKQHGYEAIPQRETTTIPAATKYEKPQTQTKITGALVKPFEGVHKTPSEERLERYRQEAETKKQREIMQAQQNEIEAENKPDIEAPQQTERKNNFISNEAKKLLATEPMSAEEAILQYFIGGGRIDTADFKKLTGFGVRDERKGITRGLAEFKGALWLVKNNGRSVDTLHEAISSPVLDAFAENSSAMDLPNLVGDIIMSHPSKNAMIERLKQLQDKRDEGVHYNERGDMDAYYQQLEKQEQQEINEIILSLLEDADKGNYLLTAEEEATLFNLSYDEYYKESTEFNAGSITPESELSDAENGQERIGNIADITERKRGEETPNTNINEKKTPYTNTPNMGKPKAFKEGLFFESQIGEPADAAPADIQRGGSYYRTVNGDVVSFEKNYERLMSKWDNAVFMGGSLIGRATINSTDDVAFLFKNLENAATENVFAVFVDKKGEYKVLWVSHGSSTQSVVDIKLIYTAAQEFDTAEVTFVHNHPSGKLEASTSDVSILNRLREAFNGSGVNVNDGVIINLDSGKYATFGAYNSAQKDMDYRKKEEDIMLPVYQFDRRKLYVPSSQLTQIRSPKDVAVFLSKQKRGTTPKIGAIILNNAGQITRYVLYDESISTAKLIEELKYEIGKHGENVILSSNKSLSDSLIIKNGIKPVGGLLDVVIVKQDEEIASNYKSMADDGLLNEPEAEYGESQSEEQQSLSAVNAKFNQELQQQIEGSLPKGHVYKLGRPNRILQSAGIEDLPIELSSDRLKDKSEQKNHVFDLANAKDLPRAVQEPIAVFESKTQAGSKVILVELRDKEKNFVVAVRVSHKGRGRNRLLINDIKSLYPKDTQQIIKWIADDNLLIWADKEKATNFISVQSTNLIGNGNNTDSYSVAKIIQNFENPTIGSENILRHTNYSQITDNNLRHETIVQQAQKISEGLHAPLEVMRSVSEVLDYYRNLGASENYIKKLQGEIADNTTTGFFDNKIWRMFVLTDRIPNSGILQNVVIHENIHAFNIKHFGRDYAKTMRFVYKTLGDDKIFDIVPSVYNSLNPILLADEYIAYSIEKGNILEDVNLLTPQEIKDIVDDRIEKPTNFVERLIKTIYDESGTKQRLGSSTHRNTDRDLQISSDTQRARETDRGIAAEGDEPVRGIQRDPARPRFAGDALNGSTKGERRNVNATNEKIRKHERRNETGLDNGRTMESGSLHHALGEPKEGSAIYRTIEACNSAGSSTTVRTAEEREELEARGINPDFSKPAFRKELRQQAKKNGVWLDNSYLSDKTLIHDQKKQDTSENDVYLNADGKTLTKLNNLSYVKDIAHESNLNALIDRLTAHNNLFPDVAYTIKGFMDNKNGYPAMILEQSLIKGAEGNATQEDIDSYLTGIGFKKDGTRSWSNGHDVWTNGDYELFDARPANVLKGKDGELYFIDTFPHSVEYLKGEGSEAQQIDGKAVGSYLKTSNEDGETQTKQHRFAAHAVDKISAIRDEIEGIVRKAKANSTYLKAPNGQPTKLNPEQWAQVRTKAFKDWFGNWEEYEFKKALDKGVFDDVFLQQLNNYIDEKERSFERGFGRLQDRFSQSEQRGLLAGGRILEESTAIIAGRSSTPNGRTRTDDQVQALDSSERGRMERIARDELNEKQEADIEAYAKAKGIWYENTNQQLQEKYGDRMSSGGEAVVYYNGKTVIKSQSTWTYGTLQDKLDAIVLHNTYFPETAMEVKGFGLNREGEFQVIVEQPYIQNSGKRLSQEELDTLAKNLGFEKSADGKHNYHSNDGQLRDLHTENVIISKSGNIYVIDNVMRFAEGRKVENDSSIDTNGVSKVVDENGEPLVVYHGTKANFNIFDFEKTGLNGYSLSRGFYFVDNAQLANGYGQEVMPVFLNMRNPSFSNTKKTISKKQAHNIIKALFDIDNDFLSNYGDINYEGKSKLIDNALEDIYSYSENDSEIIGSIFNIGGIDKNEVSKVIIQNTKKDGHIVDADIAFYGNEDNKVYVAILPNQIKSATDNVGTFDNENPDIRFHRRSSSVPKSVNSGVSKQMDEARGVKETPLVERLKERLGEAINLTQHFKYIKESEHPVVYNKLRTLEAVPEISRKIAFETIKDILAPIRNRKDLYEAFERALVYKDLLQDIEKGTYDNKQLPWGYVNADEVRQDIANIEAFAKQHPELEQALRSRKFAMKKLRQQLVDAELLPQSVMNNDDYFHHQVHEYMNQKGVGVTSKDARTHKKGWQHERTGSIKDYNTNYLESEFQVIAQGIQQLKTKEHLENIGREVNIAPALIQTAKASGDNWRDIIPEGYVTWKPKKETKAWLAASYIEKAIDEAMNNNDSDAINELTAELDNTIWVIPENIAAQLDNMRTPKEEIMVVRALRSVNNKWKQWVLINPMRVLKYNVNNFSGDMDIILASYPSILKPKYAQTAVQELFKNMRGGAMSEDIKEAIGQGIISSGLTIQEIPDINEERAFKSLTQDDHILSKVWGGLKNTTELRENILRLAAYKYFKEQIPLRQNMYGASNRKAIDAIKDNNEKAAKIARELLGDYGNLSQAGMWMRSHIYPFWSWVEINAPRYFRLFANSIHEGNAGNTGAKFVGVAVKKSAATLLKAQALMLLVQLFNRALFPDEDDELNAANNRQLRLILGRSEEGDIRTLRISGAFSDVLGFVGLEDYISDISDLKKEKSTPREKIEEAGNSFVNKFAQGAMPLEKVAFESLLGKTFYPDITQPRTIRDRGEHLTRAVSMEKVYKALTHKPMRSIGKETASLLLYNVDPGEAAYYAMKQKAFDFNKDKGYDIPSSEPTDRANALYYYKQSLKFGNTKLASYWKEKYFKMGGNEKAMKTSIKKMEIMETVKKPFRKEWLNSLDTEEKQMLEIANKWFKETYQQTAVK